MSMLMRLVLMTMTLVVSVTADGDSSVGILLAKYHQILGSSTLRWITASEGRVPEHAVQGATNRSNSDEAPVEKPVWVCRARSDVMWPSGFLSIDESNHGKCVISMHGAVAYNDMYQVLQNVEDGGKLSWVHWDRFTLIPNGTVASDQQHRSYVARHKSSDPTVTVDYHLGRLDTTTGLFGKIYVIEDGVEKNYEEGEVLVETEPIRYEMDRVKFNEKRVRPHRETVVLGSTTLRNEDIPEDDGIGGELNRVDSVIAYRHNSTISWGNGHGILSGLPVKIMLANGTEMEEFKWAIDSFGDKQSTYSVEAFLAPGRGVNVTLTGTWTEANVPFTARVTAIYPDNSRKSRPISGSRREVGIRNVIQELGPVYYLHNNSFVPTTSTTTTSTTTVKTTMSTATTSKTTSTSTEEPKPIPASPMEEMNSTTKKGDTVDLGKKRENQSMQSDGPKLEPSSPPSGVGFAEAGPVLVLGAVLCLLST